jgi:hypothetical protein
MRYLSCEPERIIARVSFADMRSNSCFASLIFLKPREDGAKWVVGYQTLAFARIWPFAWGFRLPCSSNPEVALPCGLEWALSLRSASGQLRYCYRYDEPLS